LKEAMTKKKSSHVGSTIESWLDAEGAREDGTAAAIKEVIAEQLAAEMKKGITKARMAEMMETSRAQIDRLLDLTNCGATLETLRKSGEDRRPPVAARIGVRRDLRLRQRLDGTGESVDAPGAEKVFKETASGAKTAPAQSRRAIDVVGKSNVLLMTCLGRLARATRDLLDTLDTIAKAGARFRSLADAWPDTTARTAN
jgi:antitoxin HicB